MIVTVRDSAQQDGAGVKAVQELAFAAGRAIYRPTSAAVTAGARRETLGELVAVVDTTIVGVVRYSARENRLHLIGLAVHPVHQRRGIARQLIDSLARITQSRGLCAMSLYTIEQTGNVIIFEKLGFAVFGRALAQDIESVTGQPLSEAFMVRAV